MSLSSSGTQWLLPVAAMLGTSVFGPHQTKTVYCQPGMASVNPDYELRNALEIELGLDAGIPVRRFAEWYEGLHDQSEQFVRDRTRKNSWLVRGLRIVIVQP